MRKTIPLLTLALVWTGTGCTDDSGAGQTTPPEFNPVLPILEDVTIEEPRYFPEGPTDLGKGFTNLSGPIVDEAAFTIYQGSQEYGNLAENTGGLFADLDGDLLPEVIIGNLQCCYQTHSSAVFKYDPQTGQLAYSEELSAKFTPGQGMATAIVDLDNDGHLDLFTRRADRGVHWGTGFYEFEPYQPYPPFGEEPTPSHLGAFHVLDLDHDGWLDVLMGDGHCEDGAFTITPLLQTGPKTLEARPDIISGQTPMGKPYAVLWVPIGDGLIFAPGRPCDDSDPNPGFYKATGLRDDGYPQYAAEDITSLDSAYKEDPEVSFGPLTLASPMAAGIGDLNNDGEFDLLTTLRLSYGVFAGVDGESIVEVSPQSQIDPYAIPEENFYETPWGFAIVDLDRDGREDWIVAHGNNGDLGGHNPYILKRTRVFWNATDFQFRDITDISGDIVEPGNWRALAVGDLDRDGDPDIMIGGTGLYPHIYRNDIEAPRPSLGIELKGHFSNHLGIGAVLTIDSEPGIPTATLMMGHVSNPIATSEPIVFVGTATDYSLDRIQVEWPSGYTQVLEDISAKGIFEIEEPPLVTITPSTRHVPADGESTVEIEIRPYDAAGNPTPQVDVGVEVLFGEGELVGGKLEATEFGYKGSLRAPKTPGSAVLQFTIGDQVMKVRPRIWWD